MSNTAPSRVTETLHHREAAAAALRQATARYDIATLDHVAARIRAAFPDATHLTFEHFARSRDAEPRALWATEPDGTARQLLDLTESTPALDLDQLTEDLSNALAPLNSTAWTAVRPEPVGGLWVLDLPPHDRPARIAELVRSHHPTALLVTLDVTTDPYRVINVAAPNAEDRIVVPIEATDDVPLWPEETERQIAALARQIAVLPHLSHGHFDSFREGQAFVVLPPTDEEE